MLGVVFSSWIVSFLFFFLFLVPMGSLCLLDCLLAEQLGQEM